MVKISSHQLKMGHQNCINLVLYNNRNKITCMLIDTAIIVLYSVYLHAGFCRQFKYKICSSVLDENILSAGLLPYFS